MSGTAKIEFPDINVRIFLAATVLVPWFAIRSKILGAPNPISVLLEWLALIALAVLLVRLPLRTPAKLRVVPIAGAGVFVMLSILDVADLPAFPQYWTGFGPRVAVFAASLTLMNLLGGKALRGSRLHSVADRQRILPALEIVVSVASVAWLLPSLLQPMDGWLNIGDSTEKVLDEVAGWAVGNYPGVHTSWVHSSLLGLPLAPLTFIGGSPGSAGVTKLAVVALYVNVLILCVPMSIAGVFSRSVPGLRKVSALALSMLAVTISGAGENSSMFQELSSLARALPPVALGLFVVAQLGRDTPPGSLLVSCLGVLSGLVLMNNYEYGFGAAIAATATLAVSVSRENGLSRVLRRHFAGLALGTSSIIGGGAILGGDWVGRRLGIWRDVLGGTSGVQSHNMGLFPPAFGVPTLCFALGVTASALGFLRFREGKPESESRAAAVGCVYFGVWTVGSAPYFLNGGLTGAFRTQFLFMQLSILAPLLYGLVGRSCWGRTTTSIKMKVGQSRLRLSEIESVPTLLVCCLVVGSILQAPNGLTEWRRVQMPNSRELGKTEDEWSPERLDYISPSSVVVLARQFGGVESVGWWWLYGNGIEALTGVENLLGTTGFETMRSPSMFKLGCEPVLRSRKVFVISGADMEERLRSCGFDSVRARTGPSSEGLVVYELDR